MVHYKEQLVKNSRNFSYINIVPTMCMWAEMCPMQQVTLLKN